MTPEQIRDARKLCQRLSDMAWPDCCPQCDLDAEVVPVFSAALDCIEELERECEESAAEIQRLGLELMDRFVGASTTTTAAGSDTAIVQWLDSRKEREPAPVPPIRVVDRIAEQREPNESEVL